MLHRDKKSILCESKKYRKLNLWKMVVVRNDSSATCSYSYQNCRSIGKLAMNLKYFGLLGLGIITLNSSLPAMAEAVYPEHTVPPVITQIEPLSQPKKSDSGGDTCSGSCMMRTGEGVIITEDRVKPSRNSRSNRHKIIELKQKKSDDIRMLNPQPLPPQQ
jgi:hypothetical protein